MKTFTKKLLLLSGALLLVLPEAANALPGFARQTGESCTSCHTQNMPKLNTHGRHFALSGYTLYDAKNENQSLIEGSEVALGLPAVLNVSAVLKARYVKSTQDTNNTEAVGTERGEIQVLEGSGLFFGGRVANNVGSIVSLTGDPSSDNDVVFGGKAILAYELFNGYSGLSLYSTKINGTFSGMENFNTGLNAPLKQFENANSTNAAQATGIGRGPATGLQAYYGDDHFFATFGAMIPSQNSEGLDAGSSVIPFARFAYNQPIAKTWNIMLGAYWLSGDMKASDQALNGELITTGATLTNIHKEGYGIDFEASGNIGSVSTMTTINVTLKNIVENSLPIGSTISPNLEATDNQAASIEFQVNPITPLGVKIAYLTYNNNATQVNNSFVNWYDYNAPSLGLTYTPRQNIVLDVQYSYITPSGITLDNYSEFYLSAAIAF